MGEVSRCSIAWEVAFDVLSSECTPHQLVDFAKKILGLKKDDINPSEKCRLILDRGLPKEVCQNFREYRRWVMCRAFELMEKEGLSFSEALDKAWDEVHEKCAEVGVII